MPFKIVRNDITKMSTDAIVNTANDYPSVGSGCDSAVYMAAGYDDLLQYRVEHIGYVEEGDAFISTVLFDDQAEVLYDRVNVERVEPMNDNQYYVRGCTALLDAVGGAIHHIANVHKYAREEDRPEKTLFIITTDGMENASHNFTYEKVKKMVEKEKEMYGWEFLFLGANIDSIEVAGRFGIGADRAINYESDSKGTKLNYRVLSDTVSAVRRSKSRAEMEEAIYDCSAPIREDYQRRHKRES